MSRRLLKKGRRRANRFRPYPTPPLTRRAPKGMLPHLLRTRRAAAATLFPPSVFPLWKPPFRIPPFTRNTPKGENRRGHQRGGFMARRTARPFIHAFSVRRAPPPYGLPPPLRRSAPLRHGPQGPGALVRPSPAAAVHVLARCRPSKDARKIGATISPATPASFRPRSPLQKRIVSVVLDFTASPHVRGRDVADKHRHTAATEAPATALQRLAGAVGLRPPWKDSTSPKTKHTDTNPTHTPEKTQTKAERHSTDGRLSR